MLILVFFCSCTNGRRRKNLILSLEHEEGCISNDESIREHIYTFYKNQFGKDSELIVNLSKGFWKDEEMISGKDNEYLVQKFSEDEV